MMMANIPNTVSNTILSWNCNSLNGKLRTLNDLTNPALHPHLPLPALIALCELRLKSYHSTQYPPHLNNYQFITASLADHPGTGFFIHPSLAYRHRIDLLRPTLLQQQFMDICWLQIRLPQLTSDILVASTYVNTNHTEFISSEHWNALRDCLLTGVDTGKRIIVVGDFNARHTEFGDFIFNRHGEKLIDLMVECGLTCANVEFARNIATHPRSGSVIDLVFTNDEELISDLQVDVNHEYLLSTDHLPLLTQLHNSSTSSSNNGLFPSAAPRWRWKAIEAIDVNWSFYQYELNTGLTQLIKSNTYLNYTDPTESIEAMWNKIRDCIVRAADASIGRTPFSGTLQLSAYHRWVYSPGISTAYNEMKTICQRAKHYPNHLQLQQQAEQV
jgi:hypothetical protein